MLGWFVYLNWAGALPLGNLWAMNPLISPTNELGLDVLAQAPEAVGSADYREQSQPHARAPNSKDELRDLEWGDLNFLHTTDTHGWLAGHILEAEFSGDWGDFVTFSERMRQLAADQGVDLLIVDSGDRHDGNGLSDASKHDGSLSLPIFCEIDYDVVTVGNHELYRGAASLQEFHDIRKRFGDRYVVSNVDIAVGKSWVPLGKKYRVFRTPHQNRTILALGFLFDFTGNDKHATRVTPVAEELQRPWFQKVLRDIVPTVDHVIVVSHIPARGSPEFDTILRAIREVRDTLPVSMFGGHSHIRDYKVYDDYAVALQSGRYVETVGWASVKFSDNDQPPVFSRSYIDFNSRTMAYHANGDREQPPHQLSSASHGREVSERIAQVRKKLDLDHYLAEVPQNWYTDRAPYPSDRSIYSLLEERVLPQLTSPEDVSNSTRYIFLNTGGIRFDLFKGPYTKDTGYILSPFNNEWFYIADVPKHVADQVLPIMNGEEKVLLGSKTRHSRAPVSHIQRAGTMGYVTHDDLGEVGDDTVHKAWKFHPVPNCILSVVPSETSQKDDTVTLIFHDFLAYFVEKALNQAGRGDLFDPIYHGGEKVIDLIPQYLRQLKN